MSKIYFYCSYQGSPVGFQHAQVVFQNFSEIGSVSLQKTPRDDFYRKFFDTSLIKGAHGFVAENGKYLILVKHIDQYKNFAIEADDFLEYESAWEKISEILATSTEELIDFLDKILEQDTSDSKFGFKLDAEEFRKFVDWLKSGKNEQNDTESDSDTQKSEKLFIDCRSDQTKEEIAALLGLESYKFDEENEKPIS